MGTTNGANFIRTWGKEDVKLWSARVPAQNKYLYWRVYIMWEGNQRTTFWNWFSFDLYVVSGLTDLHFTYCVIFPAHNGFLGFLRKGVRAGLWWCMPLIPSSGRVSVTLRPAWCVEWVSGQPTLLYRDLILENQVKRGVREMTHWLRVLSALLGDPGSVPSYSGSNTYLSLLGHQECAWRTDIHTEKTHIHVKLF